MMQRTFSSLSLSLSQVAHRRQHFIVKSNRVLLLPIFYFSSAYKEEKRRLNRIENILTEDKYANKIILALQKLLYVIYFLYF